jgi:hypothetical protein
MKFTKKERLVFQIIDVMGQVVRNEEVEVVSGMNQFKFNLSTLAPGKYIVRILSKGIQIPFLKLK